MGIALNLMASRQNPAQQTVVMWSGADATAKSLVLVVARRRLDPDEIELALGAGHPDADKVSVPASAGAVLDDLTPATEARYYGVLAVGADGGFKPTRFRAGPMAEQPEGTLTYSALGGKPLAAASPAAPAAVTASAGPVRGPFAAGSPPPAPAAPPVTGTGAVRGPFAASSPTPPPAAAPVTGGAVRGPFAASSPTPPPAAAPVTGGAVRGPFAAPAEAPASGPLRGAFAPAAETIAPPRSAAAPALESTGPGLDPQEARRAAQRRAQQAAQVAAGGPGAAPEDDADSGRPAPRRTREPVLETVPPSSDFPVEQFGVPMVGATQSWDGLRILWEPERRTVSAYEILIADHPLRPDEVGELLSTGKYDGAWLRSVPGSVKAVIDNVTERDARAYYGVIARSDTGARDLITCAAQSSDESNVKKAPFVDPARLDEVKSLAHGQVREAKVQLMLWTEDQDVSAWREALRIVGDALAIYPDYAAALELKVEIEKARSV